MTPPNVVWITLDSVRADHTTMGGYERDTTPRISEFGKEGKVFEKCFAHGKATLASSGAILTGRAPSHNTLGITGNVLPDSATTVAERFQQRGYRTACLSRNSFVSSETGLDRGFDRFQWVASETLNKLAPRTLLKYFLNLRSHSAGLSLDSAKHASPYLMNDTANRWLHDLQNQEPFFFYLHYNEPHRPYYPPLSYLDEFTDEIEMGAREAAEFALEVHYDLEEIIAKGCTLENHEWEALRAMYDAEIAYTDEMVGKIVDHIRSLPLEDTIIVITADHGELFGEYGLLSHKYVLIDAVTHVPMVVMGLDDNLEVNRENLVQHADIMKTILSMAGGEPSEGIGVDLRAEARDYVVSQRGPVEFDNLYQYNDDFDASKFHNSMLTALRTREHRFQSSEDRSELFVLPDEENVVTDEHPEEAAELSAMLSDWLDRHGQPVEKGREDALSESAQRQLRDLGYLD